MKNFKQFLKEGKINFFDNPEKFDSHRTDEDNKLHDELSRHYTKIPDNKDTTYLKTPGVPYEDTGHHYDDMRVIKKYTGSSNHLNSALWRNHKGYDSIDSGESLKYHDNKIISERVPDLDRIMNYHKTPKDLTLYSGTKIDPRENKNSEGILHHPAYMSTSLDRRTARSFARKHREVKYVGEGENQRREHHEHTLHIHVPKGSHGAYIDRASDIGGEKEFLLPRNTKLKYMHTDTKEIPHDHDENGPKTYSHSHHMMVMPND